MKNNIYLEALLKSFGTKSDVEIKDSYTLQEDFGKVMSRMLEDMLKIALKKDKCMPYKDYKKNFVAILYNSLELVYKDMLNIKKKATELGKEFDEIMVETNAFEYIEDNLVKYNFSLYDLCSNIVKTDDDIKTALDKIYKSISESKENIIQHFKSLETDLKVKLDYEQCIKLQETAVQKIYRDAPFLNTDEKECFKLMKDIIRCRTTIFNPEELKRIIDHFQEKFNILQIKNALDRKQVPTVYIIYTLNDNKNIPPVELQLLYKDRNKHIHDFYDLQRINSKEELYAWLMYSISIMHQHSSV
eukprot:Mrub_05864.p1 GENE.Mrub_05864~~Mrub_05864.p1  ORF type:complete len:341 (+),score=50.84 Mrub_05864:118-1023(+)